MGLFSKLFRHEPFRHEQFTDDTPSRIVEPSLYDLWKQFYSVPKAPVPCQLINIVLRNAGLPLVEPWEVPSEEVMKYLIMLGWDSIFREILMSIPEGHNCGDNKEQ